MIIKVPHLRNFPLLRNLPNFLTIASSSSTTFSNLSELTSKRELKLFDYYLLSINLFMFVNIVTKPITLRALLNAEQLKVFKEFESSLDVSKKFNFFRKIKLLSSGKNK
jgi:hypothetical protein